MKKPPPPPPYRVDDQSILLGVYRRLLWDRLTRAIPASIHPNVLTVASQLSAVLAALMSALAVSQKQPAFFAVAAFGLLSSLTFDNIDGAHARRTNQCSPLGELLDHGLDGIASASTLLVACHVLHVDGLMMLLICGLGAMAFTTVFWEQLRTGVLNLPKVGPTESVTALILWAIASAAFHDPWWLRFSFERVTAGNIGVGIFVVVHLIAILVPIIRASSAKRGGRSSDLLPVLIVGALQAAFIVRGAPALIPAITIGLVAANLTCHMISVRQDGQSQSQAKGIVPFAVYIASVPAVVALTMPPRELGELGVTALSLLSLMIVCADYVRSLDRGAALLTSRRRNVEADAE